jgi:hypothetical protein
MVAGQRPSRIVQLPAGTANHSYVKRPEVQSLNGAVMPSTARQCFGFKQKFCPEIVLSILICNDPHSRLDKNGLVIVKLKGNLGCFCVGLESLRGVRFCCSSHLQQFESGEVFDQCIGQFDQEENDM